MIQNATVSTTSSLLSLHPDVITLASRLPHFFKGLNIHLCLLALDLSILHTLVFKPHQAVYTTGNEKCKGLYVLKKVLENSRGQEETGVAWSGVCRSESHLIVIQSGALGLRCDLPSHGTSKKRWCPEHLGWTPRPPPLAYFMVRQF